MKKEREIRLVFPQYFFYNEEEVRMGSAPIHFYTHPYRMWTFLKERKKKGYGKIKENKLD